MEAVSFCKRNRRLDVSRDERVLALAVLADERFFTRVADRLQYLPTRSAYTSQRVRNRRFFKKWMNVILI